MLQIEESLLQEIYAECERQYPFEACGLIVGETEGGRTATKIVPCKNIQNELHQKDPKRYPRDAKTAYTIDSKEMEKVKNIVSIFHSHPEHGVYFSDEDKAMAAPWGEPLFPQLSYVVVSVYSRQVENVSEFYWDGVKKDFLERKIL